MKRARSISKSTESVVAAGSKDEPPKKIAKKRVKSVSTQSPRGRSDSQTSPLSSTPGPLPLAMKPGSVPVSATKLGSLPMHGEHLPEGGPRSVPKFAEKTCGNLRATMSKLKELKMKGVKVRLLTVEGCEGEMKLMLKSCLAATYALRW